MWLCYRKRSTTVVASLIFTSGTTGRPKGVMLSLATYQHGVDALFSLRHVTKDGVLSVLPLHHTFEFSTGFLTPLIRGERQLLTFPS